MKLLKNSKHVTRNGPDGRPVVQERDMRAAYQVSRVVVLSCCRVQWRVICVFIGKCHELHQY